MPRVMFRNVLDVDAASSVSIAMPSGAAASTGYAASVSQGGSEDYSEYRTATYGAPTHYADPARSLASNGAGTLGDPWNLSQAMANAVAGNVVGIMAGVSVQMAAPNNDNIAAFSPAHSGASGNRIVFVTQWPAVALSNVSTNSLRTEFRHAGSAPGISGGVGTGTGGPMLGAYQQNYITYDGFYIDMATAYLSEDSGVIRPEQCTDITFCNFVIKGAALTVASNPIIYRPQDAVRTILRNFRAYDFTNDPTGSATPQAALFSDQYGDQDFLIEHFEIWNTQRGIFIKGSGFSSLGDQLNYGTIRYGIVHDVRSAYQFNALHTSNPSELHHCLAYNIAQEGLGDGAIVFSGETTPGRNITVHHCTTAKVDAASLNTNGNFISRNNGYASGSNSVHIRDCVIDNDNGSRGHSFDVQGANLPQSLDYMYYTKNGATPSYVFNGTQYNTFTSWKTNISGRDANSSENASHPFTDRTNNDFTIASGHAALTASSTGGELGCYEGGVTVGVLP